MNISIVTGTLNRIRFLPGMVENCLQDQRNELVLVDGGSTDGTLEYLRKEASKNERLKLIEMGEKSNYASFMNRGIRASSHDLVCQWNDDVLMLDDWDKVYRNIDRSHAVFSFPWKRGLLRDKDDEAWLKLGDFSGTSLSSNKWIYYPRCVNFGIFRREVFRKVGMYSERFKFYYADADITNRAMIIGKFGIKRIDARVMDVCEDKKKRMATQAVDEHDNNVHSALMHMYGRGELPKDLEYLGEGD
jgi:glycosyltransferase involved in cell wall biosynthesis